jgi:hypothetical protein
MERAWLALVREAADPAGPAFGMIDYVYSNYGETAVEGAVGPPWLSIYQADSTARQFLRGYGWVTVLPRELADRLGGAAALRATGAFAEVGRGGVWCRGHRAVRPVRPGGAGAGVPRRGPGLAAGNPAPLRRIAARHRTPHDLP